MTTGRLLDLIGNLFVRAWCSGAPRGYLQTVCGFCGLLYAATVDGYGPGPDMTCPECEMTLAKLTAPGPKMATKALMRVHKYGARPEDFGWRYNEVTSRWYHNDGRVVTAEQLHAEWR